MYKPKFDAVSDIKKDKGGASAENLINPNNISDEVNLEQKYNKKYIPIEEVPDPDTFDLETGILNNVDNQLKAENKAVLKNIFNFIRKNEYKFKEYRQYFKERQKYLKDKHLLETKLVDNQNRNNPRQRVNNEALEEALNQLKLKFKNYTLRLRLDTLPISQKLLYKIVNLPADKLSKFKDRLNNRLNSGDQNFLDKNKKHHDANFHAA